MDKLKFLQNPFSLHITYKFCLLASLEIGKSLPDMVTHGPLYIFRMTSAVPTFPRENVPLTHKYPNICTAVMLNKKKSETIILRNADRKRDIVLQTTHVFMCTDLSISTHECQIFVTRVKTFSRYSIFKIIIVILLWYLRNDLQTIQNSIKRND
jgi:hypothetical protein